MDSRRYRLLHLSDTHVGADGPDEDGVDAPAALRRLLHDLRHVEGVDAVVVSGDLADDVSPGGYAEVLAQVGGFARERGAPHVHATGNHDDRDAFAAVLGSGHLGPDGTDVATGTSGTAERAAVSTVGGLRLVTLDSLVPGQVHGELSEAQLAWLDDVLATPAPDGTVVVLHHPPLSLRSPSNADVVLRDPHRLAEVVAGTDVRVVLAGHLHHQLSGTLAGVPVWVTPGVVTRIDLTSGPGLVRGVLGAGATVVDLGGAGTPTFHLLQARDPRAGEAVYLYDAATGADVEEPDDAEG